MKKKPIVLLIAFLFIPLQNLDAQKYDQQFVLGLTIGTHTYSKSDDFRKSSGEFDNEDEISNAILFGYFAELYFLDRIGAGLRINSMASGREYTTFAGTYTETVIVSNYFLTGHWIPFVADSKYIRFGFLGGIGKSEYKVEQTLKVNSNYSSKDSNRSTISKTSGTATLFGLYLDWGGEGFGARLGGQYLQTELDPLKSSSGDTTIDVDASGRAYYLGLRWAF